ncbi:MAG: hypothetical protein HFG95_06215 [Dorea sp.]|nr:hypothetical protein [Dorea sp.]
MEEDQLPAEFYYSFLPSSYKFFKIIFSTSA